MTRRPTPHVRFAAAALAAVIAALVIAGSAAADQRTTSGDGTVAAGAAYGQQVSAAQAQALKRRYLECDQAANSGALDGAAVISCSMVHELLKQRVFGGSFEALVAWWRQARDGGAM